MKPEDIDKLFKDRLAGLPATPSPDAWQRLQQKMEPPQKQRTMWIYYAAASVVILIISGVLFFRTGDSVSPAQVAQTKTSQVSENNKPKINEPQATSGPALASTTETIAQNPVKIKPDEAQNAGKAPTENRFKKKEPALLVATTNGKTNTNKKRETQKATLQVSKTTSAETPVLAQVKTAGQAGEISQKAFTQNNTTAPEDIVQVVVKISKGPEEALENSEEENLRESISRKGALLKNIYLQARNLKNGEPVELATLGVNTEKINTEKENIRQKINKVFSL